LSRAVDEKFESVSGRDAWCATCEAAVVELGPYAFILSCNYIYITINIIYSSIGKGCLCGLVVRVPAYRFRGPGSIPGATRFSEK
jgi:hypothetical protein